MDQEDAEQSLKLASLVERNCEFLTCIRHNSNSRTELARSSLKSLDEYMADRKCKLNNETFLQLLVELAYFYYSCKNFKAMPGITPKDIRVE
jgi:hypothetical protein